MRFGQRLSVLGIGALLAVSAAMSRAEAPAADVKTQAILLNYVKSPDASFEWKVHGRHQLMGSTATELRMVSQTWRGVKWEHQIFVIAPQGVTPAGDAILIVDGGNWPPAAKGGGALPPEVMAVGMASAQMRAPMILLRHVPFQPILDNRVEDSAIAYTFQQFIQSDDDGWPLLLPMVKSATQAMNAIQAFSKQEWNAEIKRFLVTGGSKRGWTTWLTAAVDDRVGAIAPVVFDMLNMPSQIEHQAKMFGKPSDSLADYRKAGVFESMKTPRGKALTSIVDPFAYRDRITQPKLIILGTNDPFWVADSLNLYWDALEGEKHALYIPNGHHFTQDMPRMFGALAGLMNHMTGKEKLPDPKWEYAQSDRSVTLTMTTDPSQQVAVRVWTAQGQTNDLRKSKWTSTDLPPSPDGKYTHTWTAPEGKIGAIFGEITYQRAVPLYLSTTIRRIQ